MKQLPMGAHVPWSEIDSHLELILELGLSPEIAFKGPELDVLDPNHLERIYSVLASAQIRPTVHAPFFDLNPGALDPLIRTATFRRLSQSLSAAGALNARLMVIHPGVDKWRYPKLELVWLSLAKQFFPPLIEEAARFDCLLALENIYEETPEIIVQLVEAFDSKWFGHCFDAGHWHLFGKEPMAEWLEAIRPRLFHLHLHDNHGLADEHLPVGEGTLDFAPLQQKLGEMTSLPSMTLEAHSPEHLRRSLKRVQRLLG